MTSSGTVRVEAGVFGPDLEAALAPYGLTAGHFPQSFDLATVGGWIASRGAGQYSNRYGTIEDLVRGLTVVLASGDIVHLGGHGPREAVGPDLTRLFVGSEGTLGVITEATLVVRRRAPYERRRAYSFASFGEGLNACREMLQRGARPAVLRLYDEVESARHFELDECALVVLDEGDPALVDATIAIVEEECRDAHVRDESLVERWLERRNDVSALAPLWERGLVVDTIEVAGSWSILASLHERVTRTLRSLEGMLVVSVHQSHAYLDGACLYFTFAAQPADPEAFYRRAWDVAMAEVMSAGGAVSHHHGVGRNRARFVARALGDGLPLLEGVKALLDRSGHHESWRARSRSGAVVRALSIDVGSSSLRTAIVDEGGVVTHAHQRSLRVSSPHPGEVELDATEIATAGPRTVPCHAGRVGWLRGGGHHQSTSDHRGV